MTRRLITRRRRFHVPHEVRLHVRLLEGPLMDKVIGVRAPMPAELVIQGERYRVDRLPGGYVAYRDRSDAFTPIIAWRAWSVSRTDDGARLASRGTWPSDRPIVAECRDRVQQSGHEPSVAPFNGCSCGIYSTRNLRDLIAAGYGFSQAYGLMTAWGRLVEHETGFRVQRAYPLAVIVNPAAVSSPDDMAITTEQLVALTVSQLEAEYRVPTAAGTTDNAVAMVARLAASGRLGRWTESALPADVRVALARLPGRAAAAAQPVAQEG